MALKPCKECGKEVSDKAKKCPHCGVDDPGFGWPEKLVGVALLAVLLYFAGGWLFGDDEDADASAAAAECQRDAQCWFDKYQTAASVYCRDVIGAQANYDVEWLDSWKQPMFTHSKWTDREGGLMMFAGDAVKFQNGFGAWQRMTYVCEFDALNNVVVSAQAEAGRLN